MFRLLCGLLLFKLRLFQIIFDEILDYLISEHLATLVLVYKSSSNHFAISSDYSHAEHFFKKNSKKKGSKKFQRKGSLRVCLTKQKTTLVQQVRLTMSFCKHARTKLWIKLSIIRKQFVNRL